MDVDVRIENFAMIKYNLGYMRLAISVRLDNKVSLGRLQRQVPFISVALTSPCIYGLECN